MENLIGKKFGRLTVIERDFSKQRCYYICKCDCGKVKSIQAHHLKSGATTSCRCYQKEQASKSNIKHGQKGTSLYNRWKTMRQRCNNPKCKSYKNYGARGIKVCEDWDNFNTFYEWAINNGYDEKLELDRIDNNKGYSPNNCRWTDSLSNNHNRRITVKIENLTLREIAEKYGIKYERVHDIYYRFKPKTINQLLLHANQLPTMDGNDIEV